jgi:sarcosine oxidase subunit gamma
MPDAPSSRRRSPLAHRAPIKAMERAARMSEVPFLGKLVLRGDPAKIGKVVTAVVGVPVPKEACTSTRQDETAILWIGPDEFWIVTAPNAEGAIADGLDEALAKVHHQVADVTSYYTAIELAGPRSREMLTKLTTLDLHREAFTAGQVAGSMFGRTQATLWQVDADDPQVGADGGPLFRLFVRRTMADYLWCLLAEAGFEWGMPRQIPVAGETWRLER